MKVNLVKLNFDDDSTYKYKPMSFCCDKLKDNPIIQLTEAMYYKDSDYDDIPRMCFVHHEEWTEWEEDMERDTYYQIDHCPFCGEKFEYELVAEEDVDEECQRLERERDILWRGAQTTDSKSQAEHLYGEVRELDKKINYLHEIGEYKEGYLDE